MFFSPLVNFEPPPTFCATSASSLSLIRTSSPCSLEKEMKELGGKQKKAIALSLSHAPDQTVGTPLGGESPRSSAQCQTCQRREPASTVIARGSFPPPPFPPAPPPPPPTSRGVETPRSESRSTAAVAGAAELVVGGGGKGPYVGGKGDPSPPP